jgi:hypothetical protein
MDHEKLPVGERYMSLDLDRYMGYWARHWSQTSRGSSEHSMHFYLELEQIGNGTKLPNSEEDMPLMSQVLYIFLRSGKAEG